MPRTRLRSTEIKRAGFLQPCFLLAKRCLEDSNQRVVLTLRQGMPLRIDKLQAAAVV